MSVSLVTPGGSAAATPQACTSPRVVSLGDVTAPEGTRGPGQPETQFSFAVTSSGCAAAGTIFYMLVSGTAFTDDTAVKTVTFAEGDGSAKTIPVFVIPDATPEPNETFSVQILGTQGLVQVSDGIGAGVILNDDGGQPAAPRDGVRSVIDFHGSEYRCQPGATACCQPGMPAC
jgi:hypothetical protein